MYRYETEFRLTNPVNDFDAAEGYLTEDNMTKYWSDEHEDSKVLEIRWELNDEQNGYIVVMTRDRLTMDEADELSEWICGQNSDGLGEGFEQQDFAWTPWDEDDPEWEDGDMASFDWETNDYELVFIREED